MIGKRRTELVIVVVLVIVIEKTLKAEDEHEDDDEYEGFAGFSKHALSRQHAGAPGAGAGLAVSAEPMC